MATPVARDIARDGVVQEGSSMAAELDVAAASIPADASDGQTEPGEHRPCDGPPGIHSWEEDPMEEELPAPAAPEEPPAAEARASATADMPSGMDPEEFMRKMASRRNAAIEKELAGVATSHQRTLKRRTSSGDAARTEDAHENSASDWLRTALAGSLRVFGEHIDGRFAEVQKAQENLHQRQDLLAEEQAEAKHNLEATVARVEILEQSTTETADAVHRQLYRHDESIQNLGNHATESIELMEKANKRLEAMEQAVRSLQEAASSAPQPQGWNHPPHEPERMPQRPMPPQAAHAPAPPPQRSFPPSSQPRLLARLGNLGWDTPAEVLMQRATELLESAGVPHNAVTALTPMVGKAGTGSACEAMFITENALQQAKLKTRGIRKTWVEGKSAWLDFKKSREELAPARTIHRCAELVEDVEMRRPDRGEVVKNVGAKLVMVNQQRCFYTVGGVLKATHFAAKRYSDAELASIVDFSSAD